VRCAKEEQRHEKKIVNGGGCQVWYVRLVRLHAECLGRRMDILEERGGFWRLCLDLNTANARVQAAASEQR
jgi:hypothetical protein